MTEYFILDFYTAAKEGDVEVVEYFINYGASPKTKRKKTSPLYEAIINNQIEVVKVLIDNNFLAYWAPSAKEALNNIKITQLLLEKRIMKPNSKLAGELPLSIAARKGNEEIIKMLLRYGGNVNLSNSNSSCTPFEVALEAGKLDVAFLLFNSGLDVSIISYYYFYAFSSFPIPSPFLPSTSFYFFPSLFDYIKNNTSIKVNKSRRARCAHLHNISTHGKKYPKEARFLVEALAMKGFDLLGNIFYYPMQSNTPLGLAISNEYERNKK